MYRQLKMSGGSAGDKEKEKTNSKKVMEMESEIIELKKKLKKMEEEKLSLKQNLCDNSHQIIQNGEVHRNDVFQFDPAILKLIDMSKSPAKYNPPRSPDNPGDNLQMRPLCLGDYDKGFLQLLTDLTKVGNISREKFEARFMQMKNSPENYYLTVIENTETNQIIATATLVKEAKFIHEASARGRVEDVVVNNAYRGQQLGKLLVDCMTLLSVKVGCYKVSLECRDPLVKFYSQFGFIKESNQNYMMQKWWD